MSLGATIRIWRVFDNACLGRFNTPESWVWTKWALPNGTVQLMGGNMRYLQLRVLAASNLSMAYTLSGARSLRGGGATWSPVQDLPLGRIPWRASQAVDGGGSGVWSFGIGEEEKERERTGGFVWSEVGQAGSGLENKKDHWGFLGHHPFHHGAFAAQNPNPKIKTKQSRSTPASTPAPHPRCRLGTRQPSLQTPHLRPPVSCAWINPPPSTASLVH